MKFYHFLLYGSGKFHVKVSSLSMREPQQQFFHSPLCDWVFPGTFFHYFQVDNSFYYFFLINCWPILIITLYGLPHIFSFFSLIFTVELFRSSCVTVTQRPVTFLNCSQVYTLFYCFLLIYWWPVPIIILLRLWPLF